MGLDKNLGPYDFSPKVGYSDPHLQQQDLVDEIIDSVLCSIIKEDLLYFQKSGNPCSPDQDGILLGEVITTINSNSKYIEAVKRQTQKSISEFVFDLFIQYRNGYVDHTISHKSQLEVLKNNCLCAVLLGGEHYQMEYVCNNFFEQCGEDNHLQFITSMLITLQGAGYDLEKFLGGNYADPYLYYILQKEKKPLYDLMKKCNVLSYVMPVQSADGIIRDIPVFSSVFSRNFPILKNTILTKMEEDYRGELLMYKLMD